ncbi:MAG: ATP-binding cassette domain-containing protein [Mariniblastus sp.]|nr:ATP-binding cassette domain-containing protein [Mariniblastus sp.]
MNATPIIGIEDLSRRTSDGEILLAPTRLDVFPGDRLAIVGKSGSGKTLLLRSLAALDPVQSGELRFLGQTVHGNQVPPYRTDVVYLPQRPVLFEGTVESNLQLPFQLKSNAGRNYDRQKIMKWLETLGRDASFLSKNHENLSGGEMQIVALLRAIQLDPQVLLLDEPTAALDEGLTASVEQLVDCWFEAAKQQAALVWITHSMNQAERICDTLYRVDAGRLSPPEPNPRGE